MAYTAPTAAQFKASFPAFAGLDDAVVQSALDEAADMVDDTWVSQAAFTSGRMLYTAHVLTLNGLGTSTESQLLGFSSIKMGPLELSRERGSQSDAGSLSSTSYGTRFLALMRRNIPAIYTV